MRWGRYSKEGGMRCRHYRGGKTEGGCHSCSLSVIPDLIRNPGSFSLLLSVIPDPDRGSRVFAFSCVHEENGHWILACARMTEGGDAATTEEGSQRARGKNAPASGATSGRLRVGLRPSHFSCCHSERSEESLAQQPNALKSRFLATLGMTMLVYCRGGQQGKIGMDQEMFALD